MTKDSSPPNPKSNVNDIIHWGLLILVICGIVWMKLSYVPVTPIYLDCTPERAIIMQEMLKNNTPQNEWLEKLTKNTTTNIYITNNNNSHIEVS